MKKILLSLFILGLSFLGYSFADCESTCQSSFDDGLDYCDNEYTSEQEACNTYTECESQRLVLQSCQLDYDECSDSCDLEDEDCIMSCDDSLYYCVEVNDLPGIYPDYYEDCMEESQSSCSIYESCRSSAEGIYESCVESCQNGSDTPIIPDEPIEPDEPGNANGTLLPGGISSFSGTFLTFASTVSEFIPYIIYIGMGVLTALIGFVAIRWLILWIRSKVFNSFNK